MYDQMNLPRDKHNVLQDILEEVEEDEGEGEAKEENAAAPTKVTTNFRGYIPICASFAARMWIRLNAKDYWVHTDEDGNQYPESDSRYSSWKPQS